ncbi:MAG: hypothetical protein HQK50_07390 [Oligoflexia bacterium]|nr:hypothetical protein [Oligoflexia bacterium]MBF0365378.1 hypothetical protein [Oligoflexia bacterium]
MKETTTTPAANLNISPLKVEEPLTGEALANKGLRNFRHSSDIENFYRFVHEYDLRREAKTILDSIMSYVAKNNRKKKKNKSIQ